MRGRRRCARSTASIPTSTSTWPPSSAALERARPRRVAASALLVRRARACSSTGSTRCSPRAGRTARAARALAGKHCLWVATTGGDEHAYSPRAGTSIRSTTSCRRSSRPRATAACTGSSRFIVHGAHELDERLRDAAAAAALARPPRRWRGEAAMTRSAHLPRRRGDLRADRRAPGAGLGARLPHRRRRHRPVGPAASSATWSRRCTSPSSAWC